MYMYVRDETVKNRVAVRLVHADLGDLVKISPFDRHAHTFKFLTC